MPNWSPNRNPLEWDWEAADAAMHVLRQAADRLDDSANNRERYAAEAQREWRGRYRLQFDEELRRLVGQARLLAAEFRAVADRIGYASQSAYQEKRHREAEIRRWEHEKQEEHYRDRERKDRERRESDKRYYG